MDKRNLLDDSIIPVSNYEINGGITMVQCKAENPFPVQNVCFIAINDGVDSAKEDDDFAPVARSQLVGIRELA